MSAFQCNTLEGSPINGGSPLPVVTFWEKRSHWNRYETCTSRSLFFEKEGAVNVKKVLSVNFVHGLNGKNKASFPLQRKESERKMSFDTILLTPTDNIQETCMRINSAEFPFFSQSLPSILSQFEEKLLESRSYVDSHQYY